MKDGRPLYSLTPEGYWTRPLLDKATNDVEALFNATWATLCAERDKRVADGANPAEAENDILSTISQAGTMWPILFATQLAESKNVPLNVGMVKLALEDTAMRVMAAVNGALAAQEATRQ